MAPLLASMVINQLSELIVKTATGLDPPSAGPCKHLMASIKDSPLLGPALRCWVDQLGLPGLPAV